MGAHRAHCCAEFHLQLTCLHHGLLWQCSNETRQHSICCSCSRHLQAGVGDMVNSKAEKVANSGAASMLNELGQWLEQTPCLAGPYDHSNFPTRLVAPNLAFSADQSVFHMRVAPNMNLAQSLSSMTKRTNEPSVCSTPLLH